MHDLRRGAIVLAAEKGDYAGKPRPAVIVQRESTLADSTGITLCGLTSRIEATEPMRVLLPPGVDTGLDRPSMVMIDKILTVKKDRVTASIGQVSAMKMREIDAALRRWLDL